MLLSLGSQITGSRVPGLLLLSRNWVKPRAPLARARQILRHRAFQFHHLGPQLPSNPPPSHQGSVFVFDSARQHDVPAGRVCIIVCSSGDMDIASAYTGGFGLLHLDWRSYIRRSWPPGGPPEDHADIAFVLPCVLRALQKQ
jgi:hypothetical protein